MTRIGTFSQLEPEIDKDAELSCMPDGKGGIYIAVMKSGAPGKSEVTVMLQLASRQTL